MQGTQVVLDSRRAPPKGGRWLRVLLGADKRHRPVKGLLRPACELSLLNRRPAAP